MPTRSGLLAAGLASTLGGLAAFGCRPSPASIALQLPTTEADRSVVLALSEAGATTPLMVLALDLVEGQVPRTDLLTRTLAEDEALELTAAALVYPESLERLQIPPGSLRLLPDDTPARALPESARIYTTNVLGREPAPFMEVRRRPAALEGRYIPQSIGPICGAFEVRAVPLGTRERVRFVLGVGRGALLTTWTQEAFYVTRDEAHRLQAPAVALWDAYATASSDLWMAGDDGQIFRGRLEPEGCTSDPAIPCSTLTTTPVARTQSGEELRAISGPPDGIPREVFTLSSAGKFTHVSLDQGELGSTTIPWETYRVAGDVAWVGPGEAVAVAYPNTFFTRWKSGRAHREAQPVREVGLDPHGFSAVVHLPGQGTIVGSWAGQFYRNKTGSEHGWEAMTSRVTTDAVRSMSPYEDGFVFVDGSPLVTQAHPAAEAEAQFCPGYPHHPEHPENAEDVTAVGRDLVAAGGAAPDQTQNYVRWMVRL